MWSHINKVEDERLMIISVGAENVFIKNEHSFMIKKFLTPRVYREYTS